MCHFKIIYRHCPETHFLKIQNDHVFSFRSMNYWSINLEYVTQHIERYQLSEDRILSYGDAKPKNFKIKLPLLILKFHIFWNLQYLIFKLLEGFGAKTVFSCKNGPLNCQNTNTLYRFPNFMSLFLKTNFLPICYFILNEIGISKERNVRFLNFLHQN